MLRSLLERLRGRRPDEGDDPDADDEDDGGFVRSVLDASVLTGHGGGNPEAERELAAVQREAAMLEREDRDRD
ncbi:hypothetical protein ACFQJ5_16355 [Halomicroarcula sp. GCM10025324]|jgi:hypothetical protein|uniref:hypothetical protein n=1 Tax=Haloarcula TaxID=2237 RepID=UPI0023E82B79|nr:hypothetical protein [Halomicroarcula sp. ZS-22-S1]